MAEPVQVGVVTVTFNSASVICDFVRSMLAQYDRRFRLYVVDNASTDQTLAHLSTFEDSRIVVVRNVENLGVAEGNNIGIRSAMRDGCEAVLLINNDTEFGPELLSKLLEGMEQHEADMVVPKIMFFDQPHKIWCAGGYFHPIYGWTRHFAEGSNDNGQCDVARRVDYSPTCCMLIKRFVFERVGLMDSDYFVYLDDTDFCYRARQAGVRLFYIPSACMLHKVATLTGLESDFALRYGTRNRAYYVLKNFSSVRALFVLAALQAQLIIKFAIRRKATKKLWITERALWEGVALYWRRWSGRGADQVAARAREVEG